MVNDNEQYEEVIIGGDSNTSNTVLSTSVHDLGDIQFGELTREVIVHGIQFLPLFT
jgi:thiamine monophosphate kinase